MAFSFSRITSLIGAPTSINGVITQIENAINSLVSKTTQNSNQMSTNLDMNSNRIYNLKQPSTDFEPVRMAELLSVQSGALTLLGPQSSIRGGVLLSTRPDSNNFVTGISSNGDIQYAQPTFNNLASVSTQLLIKTSNYTVDSGTTLDSNLILNGTGTIELTLPSAASFPGRVLKMKTIAAFTVVSATSDVTPLAGGAASTAILAATAGKWAELQSDGSTWIIMAAN